MNEKGSSETLEPRDVLAYFGAHDLTNFLETGRFSLSPVDIILNNKWNPRTSQYDADLSLLKFEQDNIHFNAFVQPICLWYLEKTQTKTEGTVAGWGKSEDETRPHEIVPKVIKVLIQTNERCFLETKALVDLSSTRTFCAGLKNGSGVCHGDSGGGLFIKVDNAYHLIGIVSSSLTDEGKCDVLKNAVYTDVLEFRDWIAEKTGGKPTPII